MKILILGAMDEEIEFLLKNVENKTEDVWNGYKIYEGQLSGKKVVISKSGIGKVNSAMVTQHMIDSYKPKYVVFTGVAGSIDTDIHVGDVIVANELFHHDFDATVFGYKKGQVPGFDSVFFETDKKLLEIALSAKISGYRVKKGIIATGDQFVDHNHPIKKNNEYSANCVEMEGASVAQVCTVNKVPFIVIRTMSDNADETSPGDFNANLPMFAKHSYEMIINILKNI